MKQNLFLLTLCALLLSSQLVAAPFYDLALYTSHEDNIGRGEGENNRLSDNIINYSARASFPVALPAHATLTINSGIQWFDYQRHSGFDHLNYDIGVKYRIKPDLHFTSPWYSLGIKLSHDEYDTSELSNNNAISVDVMTGKRLTDRVLVKLGLNYKNQRATTDQVGDFGTPLFDLETSKAFIGADYFYNQFILYMQYTLQTGDIVSSGGTIPIPLKTLYATQEMQ